MGDRDFQIFPIKIDHFRGLSGPLEGQGRARESKIVPKEGLKRVDIFFPDPLEVQPGLGEAGF